MKKVLLSLILIAALCLTACSGSNTPTNPVDDSKPAASDTNETTEDVTTADTETAIQPLEVKEFGYSVSNGYLYISVILHNPNKDIAIDLPSFRITARDANNALLGTQDQTISIVYPEQDFVYAGQMCAVDEEPATVDIELLKLDDYNYRKVSSLNHPEFKPFETLSATAKENSLIGEIQNNNDYDFDTVIVSVVYRDADGKLIGGTCTFVDSVSANATAPYDIMTYIDFATDSYEVYANNWV